MPKLKTSASQKRIPNVRSKSGRSSTSPPLCSPWLQTLASLKLFLGSLQAARPKRPPIQPMQPPSLCARNQRSMRNREQVFRDKPHWLLGCHPLKPIEPPHIDRTRKSPKRPLPPQIEVGVKVTDRQLAQRTIDRLTIAAAGIARFGQCAPVSIHLIDGYHVIGIVLGLEIKNQRRISKDAQRRRCKQRSLIAMRRILPQHPPRRPGAVGQVVRHGVECPLDAMRRLQPPQFPKLGRGQPPRIILVSHAFMRYVPRGTFVLALVYV